MSFKIKITTEVVNESPPVKKKSAVKKTKVVAKKQVKKVAKPITNYTIRVYDEWNNEIDVIKTSNTLQRSKIINELRELYNTDDIKYVDLNGKVKTKKVLRKITVPVVPFTDTVLFAEFVDANSTLFFNRIIEAVEEGIAYNKKMIKLFELGPTGVFLTSPKQEWHVGIEQAKGFFEKESNFELCAKCNKMLELLRK